MPATVETIVSCLRCGWEPPSDLAISVDLAIHDARAARLWWKAAEEAAHYQRALFDIAENGDDTAREIAQSALRAWRAA